MRTSSHSSVSEAYATYYARLTSAHIDNTLSPYSPTFYQSYIGSVTSFVLSGPKQASPNNFQSPSIMEQEGTWPAFSDKGEYKVLNVTKDAATGTNVTSGYIGTGSVQIGTEDRCEFWKQARIAGGW